VDSKKPLRGYFFKILKHGRIAPYMTRFKWPRIGTWTLPIGGTLRNCQNGYHLLRPRDLCWWDKLLEQIYHKESSLYLVETQGDVLEWGDKVVARKARLVKRINLTSNEINTIQNRRGKKELTRIFARHGIKIR